MLSKVLYEENKSAGIRSVTIGPGVVDTGMQKQLRSTNPEHFGAHSLFNGFKEKGMLQSPDLIGQKIIDFVLTGNYEGGRYYEISEQ
jgi:benzil reductase ((S)-benzoin forming)